jgi:tetratricopeptide (TPR) repeat protein
MTAKVVLLFSLMMLLTATGRGQASKGNLETGNELYFKHEWAKAIPYFERALGDTSKSALLWQRLAMCQFSLAKWDQALTNYIRSLRLNPNPFLKGVVRSQIIAIYNQQNKTVEAFTFLKNEAAEGFSNLVLVDTAKVFDSFRQRSDFLAIRESIKMNAYPCYRGEHRQEFDFWLGEWDVYTTNGDNLVGHSLIRKSNDQCSIMEDWTSLVSPQTGHSINYFDPAKQRWEQVYVGSGGTAQTYTDGQYQDGKMHFVYKASYGGVSGEGNFIFYNLPGGNVRQVQDFSSDGGKTYTASTDLTYKKKKK